MIRKLEIDGADILELWGFKQSASKVKLIFYCSGSAHSEWKSPRT
jgi:hypothetical protein